jgi:hypothetical protein
MSFAKRSLFNKRLTRSIEDIEMVIVEHDMCYHCAEMRGCMRRENVAQTASYQEIGFIVTRCPDYVEP